MIVKVVLCAVFSVSAAEVTRIHATSTGYETMLSTYLSGALAGTGLAATASYDVASGGWTGEYTPIGGTTNAQILAKFQDCAFISAYQTTLNEQTQLSDVVVTHACVVASGVDCTTTDVISCSSSAPTTEPTSEPASGENGSGEGSGEESGGSGGLSTGSIAAIVVCSLLALGVVVAGVFLWFFFKSSTTAVNPAALGGTGVAFGKRVPRLIISADALSGATV